jgi:hypothetical protein
MRSWVFVFVGLAACGGEKKDFQAIATAVSPTLRELAPFDARLNPGRDEDTQSAEVVEKVVDASRACGEVRAVVAKIQLASGNYTSPTASRLAGDLAGAVKDFGEISNGCGIAENARPAMDCYRSCRRAWGKLAKATRALHEAAQKQGVDIPPLRPLRGGK